jgi:hypothetical protein
VKRFVLSCFLAAWTTDFLSDIGCCCFHTCGQNDAGKDYLVYWYGTQKRSEYYSFLPPEHFIAYDDAPNLQRHRVATSMPPRIRAKMAGAKRLLVTEKITVRAFREMEEDLLKAPQDRKRGDCLVGVDAAPNDDASTPLPLLTKKRKAATEADQSALAVAKKKSLVDDSRNSAGVSEGSNFEHQPKASTVPATTTKLDTIPQIHPQKVEQIPQKVEQIDLSTDRVVRVYPSVYAAAKSLRVAKSIITRISNNDGASYNGWKFRRVADAPVLRAQTVEQIDLSTGLVVQVYPSVYAAAKWLGVHRSRITRIINKESTSVNGWTFRRATDAALTKMRSVHDETIAGCDTVANSIANPAAATNASEALEHGDCFEAGSVAAETSESLVNRATGASEYNGTYPEEAATASEMVETASATAGSISLDHEENSDSRRMGALTQENPKEVYASGPTTVSTECVVKEGCKAAASARVNEHFDCRENTELANKIASRATETIVATADSTPGASALDEHCGSRVNAHKASTVMNDSLTIAMANEARTGANSFGGDRDVIDHGPPPPSQIVMIDNVLPPAPVNLDKRLSEKEISKLEWDKAEEQEESDDDDDDCSARDGGHVEKSNVDAANIHPRVVQLVKDFFCKATRIPASDHFPLLKVRRMAAMRADAEQPHQHTYEDGMEVCVWEGAEKDVGFFFVERCVEAPFHAVLYGDSPIPLLPTDDAVGWIYIVWVLIFILLEAESDPIDFETVVTELWSRAYLHNGTLAVARLCMDESSGESTEEFATLVQFVRDIKGRGAHRGLSGPFSCAGDTVALLAKEEEEEKEDEDIPARASTAQPARGSVAGRDTEQTVSRISRCYFSSRLTLFWLLVPDCRIGRYHGTSTRVDRKGEVFVMSLTFQQHDCSHRRPYHIGSCNCNTRMISRHNCNVRQRISRPDIDENWRC